MYGSCGRIVVQALHWSGLAEGLLLLLEQGWQTRMELDAAEGVLHQYIELVHTLMANKDRRMANKDGTNG